MKRVTITYTRQNDETPWYWQVAPSTAFSPMDAFLNDNADRMEETGHTIGNQNTVILTFNDEEIYEQFKTLIVDDMKNDYVQYCQDNNITIGVVTEDV
jgi:hypothetical protein